MKKTLILSLVVGILMAVTSQAFAHSGRTDAFGGHYNRVDYGYPVYESHR